MEDFYPFLGFDLSTPATLVVLAASPETMHFHLSVGDNRAERLFPAILETLDEAGLSMRDIHSLGVGRGPGAFTGVRNAVMAAKALSWANGLPLYAPDTLEVLARGVERAELVISLIDARRGEVYCSVYRLREGVLLPDAAPRVLPPGKVAGLIESLGVNECLETALVGTGAMVYGDVLSRLGSVQADPYPQPQALLDSCRLAMQSGRIEDPLELGPLYLRDPDAMALRPSIPSESGGGDGNGIP